MFRLLVVSESVVPRTVPCSEADTLCQPLMTDAPVVAQPFSTGNPAVEQIDGTVHLFRSIPGAPSACCTQNSRVVAIVAVPSYITTPQLVRFVASSPSQLELPTTSSPEQQPAAAAAAASTDLSCFATTSTGATTPPSDILAMKLLRDGRSPSRYMALVLFATQEAADSFFVGHAGRRFNALETEACQLFYVADVEFASRATAHERRTVDGAVFVAPPAGTVELPTCPVCLERMDAAATGLLTILCDHTFHMDCLAQWTADACPVCRYAQQPLGRECRCAACACVQASALWICLVCGHIGCGRGVGSHALAHFRETQHDYSMNLETRRVWDYAGDNYVHRIVRSSTDGKLVAVDGNSSSGSDGTKGAKVAALEAAYSRLCQTHLAAFERETAALKRAHAREVRTLEARHSAERDAAQQAAQHAAQQVALLQEQARGAARQLAQVRAELAEARALNASLCENQRQLRAHNAELESQLHDLMVHLDGVRQVERNPELRDGGLVARASPQQHRGGGGARRGKGSRRK